MTGLCALSSEPGSAPFIRDAVRDGFLNEPYQRHNRRRQEHLASLRLPIAGRSVLEVGAGIGDHTSFFLDRGCAVTATDARLDNLAAIRARYPDVTSRVLDLDAVEAAPAGIEPHDIVYCYGLLYHLAHPEAALSMMAGLARELLLLETCVSFGDTDTVNPIEEDTANPTQAFHGIGCRPTRTWVLRRLQRLFPFAYVTRTQPWHDEFPLDWTRAPARNATGLYRAVFVGARAFLRHDDLLSELPDLQVRE